MTTLKSLRKTEDDKIAVNTSIRKTQEQLRGAETIPALSVTDATFTGDVTFSGTATFANTGLHILDTNASHDLIVAPGSNITADRTLSIVTGDSDRTVTLSGNPTLADWFDQSVKTTANPQFATIELGAASDTTLARSGAGDITVEAKAVYRVTGTAINAETADTAPDRAADYVPTYDASAGTHKKTLLKYISPWQVVFKTADETLTGGSSTTYQDDDALTFAVAASTKYAFRMHIFYNTPAAADFKYQFTGPSSPTLVRISSFANPGGGIDPTSVSVVNTAFSTSNVLAYAAATDVVVYADGIVQNGSNAGSVTLQWAQNSSSGTTTVYAGSFVEWAVVA